VRVGVAKRTERNPVKGFEDDFGEFVAAASLPLLRTARLLTGDWHLGQDLLQLTLAKVYVRWNQVDRWESPLGYARKVMVNTYCTWYRRRWRYELPRDVLPDAADRRDPADEVAATDELARALLALPRRHRAVVILRFYDDLSVDQTAAVLGCPPGTVTSLSARALAKLRADPDLRAGNMVEGR
jgi:RNA polymerase sigma-70 factor (sigma-E family)